MKIQLLLLIVISLFYSLLSFISVFNKYNNRLIKYLLKCNNVDMPFQAYQDTPSTNDDTPQHINFIYSNDLSNNDLLLRANNFYNLMNLRRSIRFYNKDKGFPIELLQQCIKTAGTAPSGAHQQPWSFVVVKDVNVKKQIRLLVEKEEQLNYDKRMKKSWVNDVVPLLNNTILYDNDKVTKPYLEEAPYLVVLFEQIHGIDSNNNKFDHYYVKQSVGIAAGLFFSALTNVGLFSLPSTPLNAEEDIRKILKRPANERVYLLMPVGYPADNATVPYRNHDTTPLRKDLNDIMTII